MSKYLDPANCDHALVFKDMTVRKKPFSTYIMCHVCLGHGGWNLTLDAYGPGAHFRAVCSQCSGYGYLHPDSSSVKCPRHKWAQATNLGIRLNLYWCSVCGAEQEVDSSD